MPSLPAAARLAVACVSIACTSLPDWSPTSSVVDTTDPAELADRLQSDLKLLEEGSTTLFDSVDGVEVETRIALTAEQQEATWASAVETFDALEDELGLRPEERLALEYRFALLHQAMERDEGTEPAAALRADLQPRLERLAPTELASR